MMMNKVFRQENSEQWFSFAFGKTNCFYIPLRVYLAGCLKSVCPMKKIRFAVRQN
ncbi:MAG: hypothetical protein IKZ88_05130 [Neisseriaceae bacterium]|nr:hypothetical protein [Neisseriaceae bacterium]